MCDYLKQDGTICGKELPRACAAGRTRCAAHLDKTSHKPCGCGRAIIRGSSAYCPACHYRAYAKRSYAAKREAKAAAKIEAVNQTLDGVKKEDAVRALLSAALERGVTAEDITKHLGALALQAPTPASDIKPQ